VVWIQVSRQTDAVFVTNANTFSAANEPLYFIPSGVGAPLTREVVAQSGCDACHAKFKAETSSSAAFHGGGRVAAGMCNVCHTPHAPRTPTRTQPPSSTAFTTGRTWPRRTSFTASRPPTPATCATAAPATAALCRASRPRPTPPRSRARAATTTCPSPGRPPRSAGSAVRWCEAPTASRSRVITWAVREPTPSAPPATAPRAPSRRWRRTSRSLLRTRRTRGW
jgi:hypothetical protein